MSPDQNQTGYVVQLSVAVADGLFVSLPVFAGPYERMAEFVSFKLKADGPGSRVLLPQAIIKVAHRLNNS